MPRSKQDLASSLGFTSSRRRMGRLTLLFALIFIAVLATAGTHYDRLSQLRPSLPLYNVPDPMLDDGLPDVNSEPAPVGPWHSSHVLRGPPSDSFRDNLLPDVQYITGWIGGGHTNDFMTYINYIYLGLITKRVPIIAPFAPTHVGTARDAGFIPFGDLYDVERMSAELGMHIVEWRDVKKPKAEGQPNEAIGGWTLWARYDHLRQSMPRQGQTAARLGLEVSYTRAPERAKLMKEFASDSHVSFLEVARLSTPSARREVIAVEQPFVSEGPLHVRLPPDEHLMVLDFGYYMGMIKSWEWQEEYFEPWRVASHAHWTPRMRDMTDGYLMRHFGVNDPSEIPKFIVVHVRHNDFKNACHGLPLDECFAPLSVVVTRVKEVQDELSEREEFQNPDGTPMILPVLMTSDERDPEWWEEVRKLGWTWVDHSPEGENTVEKYGRWYPLLIDAVIQSTGHGFVGTHGSTMSNIAARRVEAWQKGVSRRFLWGGVGADDHPPQTQNARAIPTNRYY